MRGSRKFSKGGGLRRKILKEKSLLIHVSRGVHIKTKQNATLSLFFLFKRIVFYIFALFYYSLLIFKFERGVANTVTPL